MASNKSSRDSVQGLFALLAITLGVIPLISLAINGRVSTRLLGWTPAADGPPWSWLQPVLTIVFCVVVIGVLERGKDR